MQSYDQNGRRKYLTPTERQHFLAEAAAEPIWTFCYTLGFPKRSRFSADCVDIADGVVHL
jgi:hypothetical protein